VLHQEAGKHLDRNVVRALLKVLDRPISHREAG
jgi:hypothetical protein